MLHYGGGYSDIKFHSHSWLPAVEEILSSKHLMGGGYRQVRGGMPWLQNNAVLGRTYVHSYSVPPYIAKIVTDAMRGFYKILIGPSAFYFKPKSLFCKMWMKEVHRRLDILLPFLPDHPPSHPRDRAGGIEPKENLAGVEKGKYKGYPVPWSFILADIIEPACLLFWPLLSRKIPPPKFEDYL